jgi:tetratricopeptide (TPR) repeat protein
MSLAERGSRVGTPPHALWMREVRKLTDSGHQVSLIGTAFEVEHTALAARLFSRWCQENFFRYMMEHFALDLLAEYGTAPLADTAKVVNPAWRRLSNQKQSVQGKLVYRHARFAEMTLQEDEQDSKRHAAWLQNKARLLEEVQNYEQALAQLKAALRETPRHIPWKDLPEDDKFNRLLPGRKRLLDAVRMIAYRAETAMVPLLMSETVDSAEARAILQALFLAEADIWPDLQQQCLRVQVHRSACPVSDRHRHRLFDHLNQTATRYPGTPLRLVYELVGNKEEIRPDGDTTISGR